MVDRDKDKLCPVCGSFLNKQGTCLNCHPTGRERKPGKAPWHGNTKKKS